MVLEAVARPIAQLVQGPAGAGHADDRRIQMAPPDQRLQRGEDLLVGQIARRTEKNEGVRFGDCHLSTFSVGSDATPSGRCGKEFYVGYSARQDSSAKPVPRI